MSVEQLAWTLTALLAASIFGNTYYLGSKIDQKIDHLSSRIVWLVGEVGDLKGEVAALRAAFEIHVSDPHAHHSH